MELSRRFARLFHVLILTFVFTASYADVTSAVGSWQTRDENTGQPNSVITIWQIGDTYVGKISKIYSTPVSNPKDICAKCLGEKRNKPMLGLRIIENMVLRGSKYVGGNILDPRDGKVYHCTMQVSSDGKKLKVRGYIGMPLFGQSKIWYRLS